MAATAPSPNPHPARPGGGPGAEPLESRRWYDEHGNGHVAKDPVPIDQHGQLTHEKHRCNRCKTEEWVPRNVAKNGPTVCRTPGCDNRRRHVVSIQAAPWLPYQAIVASLRPGLWPAVGLAAAALAGVLVGQPQTAAETPPWILAVIAPLAGWAAARGVQANRTKQLRKTERARAARGLAPTDPSTGRRRRETIARRGRVFGYPTTLALVWLAAAAQFGAAPHTLIGRILWTLLVVVVWLPAAATWWRWEWANRTRQPEPEPPPAVPVDDRDPDVAYVKWLFDARLTPNAGDEVPAEPPATVAAAVR